MKTMEAKEKLLLQEFENFLIQRDLFDRQLPSSDKSKTIAVADIAGRRKVQFFNGNTELTTEVDKMVRLVFRILIVAEDRKQTLFAFVHTPQGLAGVPKNEQPIVVQKRFSFSLSPKYAVAAGLWDDLGIFLAATQNCFLINSEILNTTKAESGLNEWNVIQNCTLIHIWTSLAGFMPKKPAKNFAEVLWQEFEQFATAKDPHNELCANPRVKACAGKIFTRIAACETNGRPCTFLLGRDVFDVPKVNEMVFINENGSSFLPLDDASLRFLLLHLDGFLKSKDYLFAKKQIAFPTQEGFEKRFKENYWHVRISRRTS